MHTILHTACGLAAGTLGTSVRCNPFHPPATESRAIQDANHTAHEAHELLSSLNSPCLHHDAPRPGKRDHPASLHAAWPVEGLAGASYAATCKSLRRVSCQLCQPVLNLGLAWPVSTPPGQNRHQRSRVSPAPRRGAVPKAYFVTCLGCCCTACSQVWSERLECLDPTDCSSVRRNNRTMKGLGRFSHRNARLATNGQSLTSDAGSWGPRWFVCRTAVGLLRANPQSERVPPAHGPRPDRNRLRVVQKAHADAFGPVCVPKSWRSACERGGGGWGMGRRLPMPCVCPLPVHRGYLARWHSYLQRLIRQGS